MQPINFSKPRWAGAKAVILQGEIIPKKKNTRLLFFHEESIHEVSRRYLITEYHSCKISGSKILKQAITQKISYEFFSIFRQIF